MSRTGCRVFGLMAGIAFIVLGCSSFGSLDATNAPDPRGLAGPGSSANAVAVDVEEDLTLATPQGSADGCGPAAAPVLVEVDPPSTIDVPPRESFRLLDLSETTLGDAASDAFKARVPDAGSERPVRLVARSTGTLYVFLAAGAIGEDETHASLMARGGVQVAEFKGRASTFDRIRGAFEKPGLEGRAALVPVGPHQGLLTRGREVAPGVLPYTVIWRGDETMWRLSAALDDPSSIIDMARSMVCD